MDIFRQYFYIVAPAFGLLFWFVVFVLMRARAESQTRGTTILGVLLAGPLHFYLRGRKYTLTLREIVGWLLVLVLIAFAPFLARILG